MDTPIVGPRGAGRIFGLSCRLQVGRLLVRVEPQLGEHRLGLEGSILGIFLSGAMAGGWGDWQTKRPDRP